MSEEHTVKWGDFGHRGGGGDLGSHEINRSEKTTLRNNLLK